MQLTRKLWGLKMGLMAKTIRDQIIEKAYWKKVNRVQKQFSFSQEDITTLARYEEVILRLERMMLNLEKFEEDESLESVEIYINGLFVYEQNVVNGGLIDALPDEGFKIEVVEILLNNKLAILVKDKDVLLNQLDKVVHKKLINELKETYVWKRITGTTEKD